MEPEHRLVALAGDVVGGRRTGDRLPDLDRRVQRPGDERQRLHAATTIVDLLRRQLIVLAGVGKRLVVPGQLENLDLLFEDLAVVGIVRVVVPADPGAQRFGLARHGAAADAADHAAAGHDVGQGEVLGEAQRMPLRQDVEHRAELELAGARGQKRRHQDGVRHHFVALVLEVVFGQPQALIPETVGGPSVRLEVGIDLQKVGLAVAAILWRRPARARVGHVNAAKKKTPI